jgi:hypothetical protein
MPHFPGAEITHGVAAITARITAVSNPSCVSNLAVLSAAHRVELNSFVDKFIRNDDDYWVWYEHPVHAKKNRLFSVSGKQLRGFLKEEIHPERQEGLDITIMSHNETCLAICNHDGQVFVIKAVGAACE